MNIQQFKKLPIMGILRGIKEEEVEPLFEIIIESGLKTIEITMNTEDAPSLIKKAIAVSGGKLSIGAGTVTNLESLKQALNAGAEFIVSPTLVKEVVEQCIKKNIPVFPGAFTPKEIFDAWSAGATMVKVFPSGFFGPIYFKEIKGPFNDIELLACSGVRPENIKEYFNSGASAVAIGSSVFKREWIEKKDFGNIKNLIREYISNLVS